MARRGRPTETIVLSDDERETLDRWARRPKSANALAAGCRIVLACAEGATNREVAGRLGVHENTVSKWRRRFVELRLDGLWDDPRPGAPRTVSDADVERVIVKTLEEAPVDAMQWSTRSMAKAAGMSQTTVSKIWRATAPIVASASFSQTRARQAPGARRRQPCGRACRTGPNAASRR